MPELPEVEQVRRQLTPAMIGARFTRVQLNRANLRVPFSADFVQRLRGRTVLALRRRGKYLAAELSSGDTLLMHLGMSGAFRVEPISAATRAAIARRSSRDDDVDTSHDHVVFHMSSGQRITFNDPRRFGLMQIVSGNGTGAPGGFGMLGPEPLSSQFKADSLAQRCAGRRTSLKAALLDQAVVAGLGNIYASEALHVARLSPLRKASTIATATGRPRMSAVALAAAIKSVLRRAMTRRGGDAYRATRFRVYGREGTPCPTPGCGGTITRITQAGRSTFFCPLCQR